MNADPDKQLRLYLLITAFIAGVLLCIYFGWFNYSHSPLSKDSSDWGSLGDFLNGFISPILSGIMIMAVIKTITLQRQMINEQRTQMTQSNNLMRVSTAIQGITSMMNYHENMSKTFDDFNNKLISYCNECKEGLTECEIDRQSLSSNDIPAERRIELRQTHLLREIEKNQIMIDDHKKVVIAYKTIVTECSKSIQLLMTSTAETADSAIAEVGKHIDDAIKTHIYPLKK